MKRWFMVGLAVSGFAAIARADYAAGSQTVAVFGGFGGSSAQYDYKPGSMRPITGGGGAFGAQYLYYFKGSPAMAIGPDITSSFNGNRRSGDLLSGYESTARVKSLVGLVLLKLAYPRGFWRPYLMGGLGAHHSTQQLSAMPQPGNAWPGGGTESRMLVDEHKTSLAVGYGIGLDLYPTDSFFFGLEFRGAELFSLDNDDNTALRSAGFTVDEKRGVNQGNIFLRVGVKF